MAKASVKTGQQELAVQRRSETGTRAVKRLRQADQIPGVVYGRDMKSLAVSVSRREVIRLLRAKAGEHALVRLRLEDGQPWEKPAIMHAIQHDPVDGHIIHIDFHAIRLTERLKVKVLVVLKGEPVGVKQEGGILEHFLREIEVECLPANIPASIEFDVAALKVGEAIHVKDLVPPPNTKITSDPASVIASVQAPKAEKPEEEAASVTEPEVIREKKEEPQATAAGEETKGEKPARSPGSSVTRAGTGGSSEGRTGDTRKDAGK